MSSKPVRDALRGAWPTVTPFLPYHETLDVPPTVPAQPIWGTFVFDSSTRSRATMGSNAWHVETGLAIIALMAPAGVGDSALVAVATDVARAWDAWMQPGGAIWIETVDAPRQPEEETVIDLFRMTVTLNYVYQFRGGP